MTKIDELIKSICNKGGPYHPDWYSEGDIENIMKEYAEWYARRCLEKAAQQAVVFLPTHYGLHGTHNVDKESITNIELIDHE